MKSLISILVLTLLFSQPPAQKRDLNSYEKMEYMIDGAKESGEPYVTKGRDFIWNCWRQKRRCFFYLKVDLKDVQPSVIQVFTEPNEKGAWNAVYIIDAQLIGKNGKPKGKPVHWESSTQEVARIELA